MEFSMCLPCCWQNKSFFDRKENHFAFIMHAFCKHSHEKPRDFEQKLHILSLSFHSSTRGKSNILECRRGIWKILNLFPDRHVTEIESEILLKFWFWKGFSPFFSSFSPLFGSCGMRKTHVAPPKFTHFSLVACETRGCNNQQVARRSLTRSAGTREYSKISWLFVWNLYEILSRFFIMEFSFRHNKSQ